MNRYELRDSEEARRFLLQGLWWQRATPPRAGNVRPVLEWAMEIASGGHDLPPLGFLADLGHLAFGQDHAEPAGRATVPVPALPPVLLRTYEDHVLGKFYADWTFSRAADALRRYQGRDRARGLAFLVRQFGQRSGFEGVRLSPGVIKVLLDAPPDEVQAHGWESLQRDGLQATLSPQYEMLIAAARRTAEILGLEDVSLLERGTALKPEGEQLAERQVLRAASLLEANLPRHRLRPLARNQEVPTHLLEEDTYPVGGFSSLSTRGSIESLLHSQLAYMEEKERPDLFDIKFLREELLYYARDENQFLRQRRTFVFVLYPGLEQTRFKDRGLEYQRGVLLLALLYTLVRKLGEWLSTDALSFRFLFVADDEHDPLAAERALLASLLRDPIAGGTMELAKVSATKIASVCTNAARRSLCHVLLLDSHVRKLEAESCSIQSVQINGPRPVLSDVEKDSSLSEHEDPLESWSAVLQTILQQGMG